MDEADLARRFDALGDEFKRAHGGIPQEPENPHPAVSEEEFFRAHGAPPEVSEDIPLTLDALFSNKPADEPAAKAPVTETSAPAAPMTETPAPVTPSAETSAPAASVTETPAPVTPLAETSAPETPAPQAFSADRPLTLDEIFADTGEDERINKKRAEKPQSEGNLFSKIAGAAVGSRARETDGKEAGANERKPIGRNGGNGDKMTRSAQNQRNGRSSGNGRNSVNSRSGRNGRNGKKRRNKRESIGAKIVKWIVSVIVVLIIALCVVGLVYFYSIIKDTPRYDPSDIESTLKVMSTIYDDQGQPMQNIYLPEGQRTLATFDQFPDHLVNAIVAIEDKTFWTHKGFNMVRMAGAILESLRGGGDIAGTSTISQQLARNIWLFEERSDRTIDRKIREAFYARELEKNLSKEEILTIYLNTIALGNHSYGIVAAAENYFGKRVEDLTLIESAALAALPKAPSQYAMIVTVSPGEVAPDDPRILLVGSQYIYLYNDAIEPRLKLVLSEMLAQGYITQAEYDEAVNDNIRRHLRPREIEASSNADFFVSYTISQIADDLLKYDATIASRDEAIQKIYSGGLDIYTTFNQRAQDIATEEFNDPENFPYARLTRTDDLKNITDEDGYIILFKYDNMFETRENGRTGFHLVSDGELFPYAWSKGKIENEERRDFAWRPDGSMEIFSGPFKRLGIYRTVVDDITEPVLEFKDFYTTNDDGVLYIVKGGQIPIPAEYKGITSDGNLILSAKFFDSEYNIFTKDEEGELWIDESKYTLRQEVIQPQAAFVLIEHGTGQIKAMAGGRDIKGQFQFDRTRSPRPPGSSIKPIAVYAPAIEMSANGEQVGGNIPTYGPYWSPMSIIIDEQMTYKGQVWPKNWYSGFRGPLTMRTSIEQSVNVNAVKTQLAIGDQRSINMLQKLGVTSLVLEQVNGVSDLAPGALALGGMTKGISPFEMASAYGTFANAGVHVTPITYTLVKDKRGNVILDGTPEQEQVMNPGTAFIMNDMLTTTVSRGLATAAKVPGTIVAGKTGTTSEHYDAWFDGNTPKYSAAVWIGCDVQVELSAGSAAASALFSKIMTRITEGEDQGEFPPQPENVVSATVSSRPMNNPDSVKTFTDYFIVGTVPEFIDLGVEEVEVCAETGYLATPWCPHKETREFSTMPPPEEEGLETETVPKYFCFMHNLDPAQFPPDPNQQFNYNFGKIMVPNLVGSTVGNSIAALTDLNLRIGEIFTSPPNSFAPSVDDIVISQSPPAGEMIPENSMVNITIEKAPAPPPPPPPPIPEPSEPETTGLVTASIVKYNTPGSISPGIQNKNLLLLLVKNYSPLRSSVAS